VRPTWCLSAAIDPGRQRDLLGILAVFAEELVQPGQLERIVGKERLMQSKMVSYLYRDQFAEQDRQWTARLAAEREAAERQAMELSLRQTTRQAVQELMIARFPSAPLALLASLQAVDDLHRLLDLLLAVAKAPDQHGAARALAEAGSATS